MVALSLGVIVTERWKAQVFCGGRWSNTSWRGIDAKRGLIVGGGAQFAF